MGVEALPNLETESQQPIPFAMLFAEETRSIPITGQYNEGAQVWEGMTSEFSSAPTATSTSTYTQQGPDADYDQDWIEI